MLALEGIKVIDFSTWVPFNSLASIRLSMNSLLPVEIRSRRTETSCSDASVTEVRRRLKVKKHFDDLFEIPAQFITQFVKRLAL
jgi:hypothetical protein